LQVPETMRLLLVAAAVSLAAAAPTPTVVDRNADPHFLTGVYGMLRTSGDRVGRAARQVFNVQGNLDDVKEDLHTEYERWQKKSRDLTDQRDQLALLIQEHQAALAEQRSLRALAERLQGDLQLARAETEKVETKHEVKAKEWSKEQQDLTKDIDAVEKEIEDSALERQQVLNATRNRTDAILARQRVLEEETLRLNEAVRQTKSIRDQHTANTSRVETEILAETTNVRRMMGDVQVALQGQAAIALQEARLAQQADEVARLRAHLDEQMYNCTSGLTVLDAQVAQASQEADKTTEELKRCQDLDAQNQEIEAQISACRAESVSSR
jgi:chromosome segregation ATPase